MLLAITEELFLGLGEGAVLQPYNVRMWLYAHVYTLRWIALANTFLSSYFTSETAQI